MLVFIQLKSQQAIVIKTADTLDDLYRVIEKFRVHDIEKITLTDFTGYLETKVNR